MSPSVPSSLAMPHACLSFGEHGIDVFPPKSFDIPSFDLIKIPKTLTDAMAIVSGQFLAEYDRCMALVILLDCKTQAYTCGIPRQRVARDAACWQTAKQDFPNFSASTAVIGSFQFRRLAKNEAAIDAIPPCQGIHLVATVDTKPLPIHSFVHVDGIVRAVPAMEVIVDDLSDLLTAALPRIQIL